ncbi:aldehyde dehydrogenase family protein, partial [Burkholderia cenocepacia]
MSTAELSRSTHPFVLPAARIAGQPVRTHSDTIGAPVFNASTGNTIGWQEFATPAHVDAAVRAARDAFAGWRDTPPAERGRVLAAIAGRVDAARERLAALQMQVSGKPPFEADADVGDVVATFAYYAKLCEDPALFAAEPVALPSDGVTAERFHDPVGVAALVMPWNFPMVTTAWKLAPA